MGSHIVQGAIVRRPAPAPAPRVARLDLVTALLDLDRSRLHKVLCALIPDDTHAARVADTASHALELRHQVVDDRGQIHVTNKGGVHVPHGFRHPWSRR